MLLLWGIAYPLTTWPGAGPGQPSGDKPGNKEEGIGIGGGIEYAIAELG